MASSGIKIHANAAGAVVILLLTVTALHTASAVTITCGDVASGVASCMAYTRSGQGTPSMSCCSKVKSLNSKAATTADRQMVCNCLKNLAKSVSFNAAAVANIPSKCGVNVPFVISSTTDCSKIH